MPRGSPAPPPPAWRATIPPPGLRFTPTLQAPDARPSNAPAPRRAWPGFVACATSGAASHMSREAASKPPKAPGTCLACADRGETACTYTPTLAMEGNADWPPLQERGPVQGQACSWHGCVSARDGPFLRAGAHRGIPRALRPASAQCPAAAPPLAAAPRACASPALHCGLWLSWGPAKIELPSPPGP
jgi:hypothetical protein